MNILSKGIQKAARLRALLSQKGAVEAPQSAVGTKAEEFSRWAGRGIDPSNTQGSFACQRLSKPFFIPAVYPEFKILRTDSLYAIGSCFARGIENALKGRGFRVESAAADFDRFPTVADKKVTALGFTNKYSTYSILNELRWALEPGAKFPEDSLVDLDQNHCVDPHINPTLQVVDRTETLERRKIIHEVTSRIRQCRVVFITLGLVEVWYDRDAEVYLNTTPTSAMRTLHPNRYEFQVSNWLGNMENLERIHELLLAHGHPEVRIIVTTSPVPLQATFSGQDVVVANSYSKSTLRAAAQDFAAAHNNVQYFPSYEIVINSQREKSWENDLRHVRGEMTQHIMSLFMEKFVEK